MGIGAIVPDIVKDVGKDALMSIGRTLEETETGKIVKDTLQNKLEPLFAKNLNHELSVLKQGSPKPTPDQILNAYSTAKDAAHNQVLGSKRQFVTASIESMYKERGITGAHQLANIFDVYLKDSGAAYKLQVRAVGKKAGIPELEHFKLGSGYSNEYQAAESWARKMMSPLLTARIAIPHFTQSLNNLLTVGWKNTASAIADFAKDGRDGVYDFAMRSGALSTELHYEMLRTAQGTSKWTKIVDPMRKIFLFERKWQLTLAAVAGKHGALEAAEKFASSTGSDEAAKIQLKMLGLDPQDILKQGGKLTDEQINTAAFRNAQETMFIRSPLQTPRLWQSNAGYRTAWMYKDYGFNQARLLKDSFKRAKASEGYLGVAKVAATIGTTFTLAGEFVKQAENIATLHMPFDPQTSKRDLFENEYLDALAHFGGFGIYYSMLRSATKSGLQNFMLGPLFSTGAEVGNELGKSVRKIANGELPETEMKQLYRSIAGRAGILGPVLTAPTY